MSVYLIRIENHSKVARPIATEAEYRQLRDSREQQYNLLLARQGNDQAKRRLVQFNYSGHYPNGVVKGTRLPSAAFGFDIDEPGEFERVSRLLLAEPERYGLLMVERSARQGGHCVFRREQGRTILENQCRIAAELRCEMDTSAHDINRVYFSTTAAATELLFVSPDLFNDVYDEEAVGREAALLAEREKGGLEVLPGGAHKANKHFRPWAEEECGVRSFECGVRSEECGVRSEECGVRSFECGVRSVECGVRSEECGVRSVECEVRSDECEVGSVEGSRCYQGIPYSQIIQKWWEQTNGGNTPKEGDRNTLIFQLACNLRHICGFDARLMDEVIPCYDNFPHEEKMRCIQSALGERMTLMPRRLQDVLAALRRDLVAEGKSAAVDKIDEMQADDALTFVRQLPEHLPMGVQDSVEAVEPRLRLAALIAICPAIGALATGVRVSVHGQMNTLNLISYIAGEAASGKGSIDPVIGAWMHDIQTQDAVYTQREDEWRQKKRAAKNAKQQPVEPKLPVRFLTLNSTVANLAERLANTAGRHAFSYTPEADTVTQRWRQNISDFSIMLRQAYDASRFDREARSVDAVSVHIPSLKWNVTMCGTPCALDRLVSNLTDGFQTRIALARTPDNTYLPLQQSTPRLSGTGCDNIRGVAKLLTMMEGSLELPKLELHGQQWLETVRLQAAKNDDGVMARQRMRVCVTAQRMTACVMLCKVCGQLIRKHGQAGAERRIKASQAEWQVMMQKTQDNELLGLFDTLADSMLDTALYFFRERLEKANDKQQKRLAAGLQSEGRLRATGSVYDRLPNEFSLDEAWNELMKVKGADTPRNRVSWMLGNWGRQGLVERIERMTYRKTMK